MAKEYLDKTGLSYFWGKITSFVNDKLAVKNMTFTRTENNYVGTTEFNRLFGKYSGAFGIVSFNLGLSASLPTGSGWITIGKMSPAPKADAITIVPCQSNASNLLVAIYTNGDIKILNGSGIATGSNFFRQNIPVYMGQ